MVTGLLGIFMGFVVEGRLLLDVLVSGDRVSDEAAGAHVVDVVVGVGDILVGFVEGVAHVEFGFRRVEVVRLVRRFFPGFGGGRVLQRRAIGVDRTRRGVSSQNCEIHCFCS